MNKLISFLGLLILIPGLHAQLAHSDEVKAAFENLYTNLFTADQPGGCVMVQIEGQNLFQKCGGIADMKNMVKINENTIFNTGSISKTIVAYGILKLHQEKKISIEDPLVTYFPDFENPEVIKDVKIKHLLTHSSGLPDARRVSSNRTHYMTAKDLENFDPLKQIESLNFQPGSQFEYSNPAFNGLALIIEKVTRQPWQTYIQENIFDPAMMTQSVITNGSFPESGVAHAYDYNGSEWIENDYGEFPTFAAAGNGGVWCSIRDLVRYETAIQNHVFVDTATTFLSRTVFHPYNWNSADPPQLGCSWFIDDAYDLPIYYHTGSQGGFRAFHYVIPDANITYVALFNYPPQNFNALIDQGISIFEKFGWINKS